jgi:hypothetical protein
VRGSLREVLLMIGHPRMVISAETGRPMPLSGSPWSIDCVFRNPIPPAASLSELSGS